MGEPCFVLLSWRRCPAPSPALSPAMHAPLSPSAALPSPLTAGARCRASTPATRRPPSARCCPAPRAASSRCARRCVGAAGGRAGGAAAGCCKPTNWLLPHCCSLIRTACPVLPLHPLQYNESDLPAYETRSSHLKGRDAWLVERVMREFNTAYAQVGGALTRAACCLLSALCSRDCLLSFHPHSSPLFAPHS